MKFELFIKILGVLIFFAVLRKQCINLNKIKSSFIFWSSIVSINKKSKKL